MDVTFDELMPRLVAAYERGRLVPFIGSGMSVGACPTWLGFVAELERAARLDGAPSQSDPESLIQRAQRATRKLRLEGAERLASVTAQILRAAGVRSTPQTDELAAIWWPLVLTTNWDDVFVAAHRAAHQNGEQRGPQRPIEVLGRSPIDCHRVLASLSSPSHTLLWAMQGHVGSPCTAQAQALASKLRGELVIGHQEYRTVTNREVHFRRAFAEVYRNRSLLFVGSGLAEHYLRDLFGEVLEMYGPGTRPHYALVHEREPLDAEFMLARFHTIVCRYREHSDVPLMLRRLRQAIEERASREVRWSFAVEAPDLLPETTSQGDFVVVRGPLRAPREGEALLLSGGLTKGRIYFGPEVHELARALGVRHGAKPTWVQAPLAGFESAPNVYVFIASSSAHQRDLRELFPMCREIFERFERDGWARVVIPSIYSGPKSRFPERHAFVQVARAFGCFRRAGGQLALEMCVTRPGIYRELASERLDVPELLASEDIRFWVDVVEANGSVERRLMHERPDFSVSELCERLALPASGWTIEVSPSPSPYERALDSSDASASTLIDLGVVPGSSIVVRSVGDALR
ncbi:MAG: SIR2 family protein [Planctomycetes bacterium]|nr:SIR2 family protein [Planctomycetota bacterium]